MIDDGKGEPRQLEEARSKGPSFPLGSCIYIAESIDFLRRLAITVHRLVVAWNQKQEESVRRRHVLARDCAET